jgi:flagellar biosynthesis/type III secretory pathway protein FliH
VTGTAPPYAFEQLDTSLRLGGDGPHGVDRTREQAWAEGAADGRQAGLAQAAELARPALAALSDVLGQTEGLRAELAATLERDAVELAIALAEHILGAALEVQPERVIDSVRGALRRLHDRRQVTAVVNPEDLELVGELVERLRGELGGIEHLGVQADRRIARGGAVVRTLEGEIDAQVATALERARAVVAAELARG